MTHNLDLTWEQASAQASSISSSLVEVINRGLNRFNEWQSVLGGRSLGEVAIQFNKLAYHALAASGTDTTVVLGATASTDDDEYNNLSAYISEGTGKGESATITDYVGSTKTATVNFTSIPDATSKIAIASIEVMEMNSMYTACQQIYKYADNDTPQTGVDQFFALRKYSN